MTPARRAEILLELAKRVAVNMPRHDDPEAFHIEKSEITHQLRKLARQEVK